MKPSQPAQDGKPGSSASIHGSASQSNTSFRPNHSAASASSVSPSVLKKTASKFRREKVAHGGAGGFEDHGRSPSRLST